MTKSGIMLVDELLLLVGTLLAILSLSESLGALVEPKGLLEMVAVVGVVLDDLGGKNRLVVDRGINRMVVVVRGMNLLVVVVGRGINLLVVVVRGKNLLVVVVVRGINRPTT